MHALQVTRESVEGMGRAVFVGKECREGNELTYCTRVQAVS